MDIDSALAASSAAKKKKKWRLYHRGNGSAPPRDAPASQQVIWSYGLQHPFPEEHSDALWKAYLAGRAHLDKNQSPEEDDVDDEDGGLFRFVLRTEVPKTLKELESFLPKDTRDALSDGFCVISGKGDGSDDMDSAVQGQVFVRIHPVHSLSLIELGLFHY
jgi:hypothetical protein